ncbi:hypothetical protein G7092_19205 [Mucilaginibacter sp. HC2]|uniref:hypothetical protein n=1 Tax=Mucilaginibacter inviolabilis TaxID=2714892 RepID=UPI00140AA052|nr:hypothetical protein [Mucilaginibacter inviolabilis]NHA05947.1 hypothetical protein [Mucilaginibacter inviolabilis]
MNIDTILNDFHQTNNIGEETINHIKNDPELRAALVNYFKQQHDREFAIKLLDTFIEIRKQPNGDMPAEDLMLASYILGLHGHIEDCLKIWEAKYADFDTYCGFDTQLVMFAGLHETIQFLETQTNDSAQKALEYIKEWFSPDPEELAEYFSPQTKLWFI